MKKTGKELFDEDDRLVRLTELGDSLEKLNKAIDWEMFRHSLTKILKKETVAPGGRPPYDRVMMFKVLILQQIYQLSDEATEFLINDRMSFMRFLGLTLHDQVPDAKTIWHFRNELAIRKADKKLFEKFQSMLEEKEIITYKGSIVDASFRDVPRQRNTPEENASIKEGKVPENWEAADGASKHKKAQKDTDARWAKKRGETHYGYKNHIKVDSGSKIITAYEVTNAAVHDSQMLIELLGKKDKVVYADSAYKGEELEKKIPKHMSVKINERAYRGKPLNKTQKKKNKAFSKVRVRVEHVFGQMKNSFGNKRMRCIGLVRACFNTGMLNLTYNIMRYKYLSSLT